MRMPVQGTARQAARIAAVYRDYIQIVRRKDSGNCHFADLKGKRPVRSVLAKSAPNSTHAKIFEAAGMSL